MKRAATRRPPGVSLDGADVPAPALRDAAGVLARPDADEAEAERARVRYRSGPMAALEPDASIAPLLAGDECVLAVRRHALLDRREPGPEQVAPTGLGGDLYLTSRRLVLVGRANLSLSLDAVEETALSGDRLMLVMRDGSGVTVIAPRPRLLRVEIAAARAAARDRSSPGDDVHAVQGRPR